MLRTDLAVDNVETTSLQPVAPGERIFALDVLRGFALLGVLIAYAMWSLGNAPKETFGQIDQIILGATSILVDTKAYTILAILFGLGFSLQFARATDRGVSVVRVYVRRMAALILIGVVHALLLRNGDILVPYAAIGFILLLLRNKSNRTLLVWGIIGLILPEIVFIVWEFLQVPFPRRPSTDGMNHLSANLVWVRYWYSIAVTFWPASLPMFVFGMYLGRRRFFENLSAHRRLLWGLVIGGLIAGISGFAGIAFLTRAWAKNPPPIWMFPLPVFLKFSHSWGFAVFYGSSLMLLLQFKGWRRLFSPISAVGRMALTNYLLQSIILVPVCLTFDLFDRVTPLLALLLASLVWAFQVPFSGWWLRRFRFGPAEWLWRSLSYGYPQPMRINNELRGQIPAVSLERLQP